MLTSDGRDHELFCSYLNTPFFVFAKGHVSRFARPSKATIQKTITMYRGVCTTVENSVVDGQDLDDVTMCLPNNKVNKQDNSSWCPGLF